jgi:hypothetical protein
MAGITFGFNSHVADSVFGYSQAPIRAVIEKRAEAHESSNVLKKLFCMEKTNKPLDKITAMTAMDDFLPVGENGAHPAVDFQESYSKIIEQETWKSQFSITREAIDDAVAMDMRRKPQAFVDSYYRARERFGARMFGHAIKLDNDFTLNGKKFNCQAADGQDLFATDHPSKVSGAAQSNYFADAFSADALIAMETAMQNFKGDNDNLLDVAPDTIVIPNLYALKKAVFAAIDADKDPLTANNASNAYIFGRWNVIVWAELNAYITSSTAPWILLDSRYNDKYMGAVWLDRVPLEVTSDIDGNTDANIWRGYSRFSAGFNDWRFAAVGGIASGTALL